MMTVCQIACQICVSPFIFISHLSIFACLYTVYVTKLLNVSIIQHYIVLSILNGLLHKHLCWSQDFYDILFNFRLTDILDVPSINPLSGTYVTGGGGLGGQMSSIDEAYNFFATRNPLDLDVGGGGIGAGIPNYNTGGDYGGGGGYQRSSPTPRVTFADEGPPST
ncbi:uncharacterized protein LOC132716622, partial [Ruditapes philippinarum]|uniref:uncharacterized protein LOC132716622 n=1 Tax=Ruditapes philippinarum TaxID=129788 RepID=UPI00295BA720